MNFIKKNWFIIGIFISLLFGLFFPEAGKTLNYKGKVSTILVALLFLIQGFTLPTENIWKGLKNFKLHLLIQSFIFIICPLWFVFTTPFIAEYIDKRIIIGILALSCLPTTVSSCTVLTVAVKGNTVGTMFNAALSNITGIFLSPLILSFLLNQTGRGFSSDHILKVLTSLVIKMLFPIILGQVLRLKWKSIAADYKKKFGIVSNTIILVIIFFSFAKSSGSLLGNSNINILPLILYLTSSNLLLISAVYGFAKISSFPSEDVKTILFTAPQKTLAMGVPLLTTFFHDKPELLAFAIIPILIYHPWQLIVAGFQVNYFKQHVSENN